MLWPREGHQACSSQDVGDVLRETATQLVATTPQESSSLFLDKKIQANLKNTQTILTARSSTHQNESTLRTVFFGGWSLLDLCLSISRPSTPRSHPWDCHPAKPPRTLGALKIKTLAVFQSWFRWIGSCSTLPSVHFPYNLPFGWFRVLRPHDMRSSQRPSLCSPTSKTLGKGPSGEPAATLFSSVVSLRILQTSGDKQWRIYWPKPKPTQSAQKSIGRIKGIESLVICNQHNTMWLQSLSISPVITAIYEISSPSNCFLWQVSVKRSFSQSSFSFSRSSCRKWASAKSWSNCSPL